jgi:hypothetical protein
MRGTDHRLCDVFRSVNTSRLTEKLVSSLKRYPNSRIHEYAVQQPVGTHAGIWERPNADTVMYSVWQMSVRLTEDLVSSLKRYPSSRIHKYAIQQPDGVNVGI